VNVGEEDEDEGDGDGDGDGDGVEVRGGAGLDDAVVDRRHVHKAYSSSLHVSQRAAGAEGTVA
jgi:hypothetical protein